MSGRPAAVILVIGLMVSCSRTPVARSSSEIDSTFARGDSLYKALNYDSARGVWITALVEARSSSDSFSQARLLTEIALANWRVGNLAEARLAQQEAIDLKRRLRLGDSSLSRSFNGLGLVAYDEGKLEESVQLFERAIAAARAAGDANGLGKAFGNLGLPQQQLGDLNRARANFRMLRETGRTLKDARLESNGLLNLASVDIWAGDPAPAIARLDSARQLYRTINYRTGEQEALAQLATAFELTGEYDRAFAVLDTSLSHTRQLGRADEEGDVLRLIAGLHGKIGDWRRAIRYYEQADSSMRTTGSVTDRGAVIRGAATAYLSLGNFPRAQSGAENALRAHLASGQILEQFDDLLLLGDLAARRGDASGAYDRLRKAAALAERLNTRGATLSLGLAEARAADRFGDATRGLRALRSLAPNVHESDLWAQWESNALAARAYTRQGALDSAAASGRRAVAAIERVRAGLGSEALRATLIAERVSVYGDLVLVLLRQGRVDEAFAVADAARSRSLLEHLSGARTGQGLSELSAGEDLLRKIDVLVQRLRTTRPTIPPQRVAEADTAAAAVIAQLNAVRGEYEALMTRTARRDPRLASMLGMNVVRLDDLRAALAPDEALLEYLLVRDRLLIFVVRRDGFRVMDEALDPAALSQRVELLRDLWGSPDGDWHLGIPAARALDHTLLAPVRGSGLLEGVSHILVVPHGVLGQLPFAALQSSAGRFLIEDYALTSLPSAAALGALRQQPIATAARTGGQGLAPFPTELPASAGEVAAFKSMMPNAETRIGRRATESAVRAALGKERPVHVATHATLNVRNPMFSRIELARSSGRADGADDGRLEVHELLGLPVRSPLVFLSGCETGAGRAWSDDPVRGTADLTLAQAVLAAGADNVISTLWRIDDSGAASFAGRFYSHLRAESVRRALAAAQREMLRDARYGSPYYWAGYTLSGEGRFGWSAQTVAHPSVSTSSPSGSARSVQPRSTP